jgi:hypothetical protein
MYYTFQVVLHQPSVGLVEDVNALLPQPWEVRRAWRAGVCAQAAATVAIERINVSKEFVDPIKAGA